MNQIALELLLPDIDATNALGTLLAATRPEPAVVYLIGDLGAGKSSLARAALRALGVRGAIRSPTYTLVERYSLPNAAEALHLDLYRIVEVGELEFLGLTDVVAALWLVEWPERSAAALPMADLEIRFQIAERGRRARLTARTEAGRGWANRISTDPGLRAISSVS